jgi:hypothetical protein
VICGGAAVCATITSSANKNLIEPELSSSSFTKLFVLNLQVLTGDLLGAHFVFSLRYARTISCIQDFTCSEADCMDIVGFMMCTVSQLLENVILWSHSSITSRSFILEPSVSATEGLWMRQFSRNLVFNRIGWTEMHLHWNAVIIRSVSSSTARQPAYQVSLKFLVRNKEGLDGPNDLVQALMEFTKEIALCTS